jgi:hypothetical protein
MQPQSTPGVRAPNCLSATTMTPRARARARRARFTSIWGVAALCATAGCSLLAPSDRELAGGDPQVDDAGDAAGDRTAAWCGNTADCGSGTCCPAGCNAGECASCSLNGGPCRSDLDCCSRHCSGSGLCQEACSDQGCGPCAPPGGSCSQSGDCCSGSCIGGGCAVCLAVGASCRTDTDCCSLVCDSSGACSPCLAAGSPCGGSGGAHCCSARCRGASSCQ